MKKALLTFSFFVFFSLMTPAPLIASAGDVYINEAAWMGTKANSADEWIELYNSSDADIDIGGWRLYETGGQTLIIDFSGVGLKNSKIPAHGYFLIERGDDQTISDISADLFGSFSGGGLSNSGEYLVLKNKDGVSVDEANFSSGWPAGKASPDYTTMERIDPLSSGSDIKNWASNNGSKTQGKDSKGFSISGTPKSQNSVFLTSASPGNQSSESADSTSSSAGNSEETSSLKSLQAATIEPHFKVDAGRDIKTIAGAVVVFHGRALGFKNEPLDGGRYLWNFGDGMTGEGQNASHAYRYPGNYVASLSVSSGYEAESDYLGVTAVPNSIFISEISPNSTGFIEITNASGDVLDIGLWILRNNDTNASFMIPEGTKIGARASVVFPNDALHLLSDGENSLRISLLYPNNVSALSVIVKGPLEKDGSYERVSNENFAFTLHPTPGAHQMKKEEMRAVTDSFVRTSEVSRSSDNPLEPSMQEKKQDSIEAEIGTSESASIPLGFISGNEDDRPAVSGTGYPSEPETKGFIPFISELGIGSLIMAVISIGGLFTLKKFFIF